MLVDGIDKKKLKYQLLNFKDMSQQINKYLKEEDMNISFKGYINVINNYLKFIDNYIDDISSLIRDLNFWLNVLSDMEGFIEYYYLKYELELDVAISKNYNPNTEYFENLRKKKVHFKEYLRQVKVQRKFFLNANWHCSREFSELINKSDVL